MSLTGETGVGDLGSLNQSSSSEGEGFRLRLACALLL